MDVENYCIPISFKSYKSHTVTRSVLSAEIVAFVDLIYDAFALRAQLEYASRRSVAMHLLTESKSLFDIISRSFRISEERVMLVLNATRQAFINRQISNIHFVRNKHY